MRKHFISVVTVFALIFLGKLFISSTPATDNAAAYQSLFESNYNIFALNVPENIDFCGERVPLEDREVQERFDRELHINTYWQSQTLLLIKRANRYFPIIRPILKQYGIPDDFKYLPLIESGFQDMVSPAGAEGPWQFLASTGRQYHLEITESVDERYHIIKSTEAACRYLKDAYKIFGSWALVAAAYNMGSTGVKNSMENQQVDNYYDLHLNEQTARYLFRLLAIKEIMENPKKYGFHYQKRHLYQRPPTYTVKVDSTITSLSAFAKSKGINYKMLRQYNPWIKGYKFNVRAGKSYVFHLPKIKSDGVTAVEEDVKEYDVKIPDIKLTPDSVIVK